jgi:hypothetical protein
MYEIDDLLMKTGLRVSQINERIYHNTNVNIRKNRMFYYNV